MYFGNSGNGPFGQISSSSSGLNTQTLNAINSMPLSKWDYLRTINQTLSTTSSPSFYDLTLTDKLKIASGAYNVAFQAPLLSANRTITLPDANITLPSQSLNIGDSVRFAKIGLNQAAGTEALEVTGNIKIQHPYSLICHTTDPSTAALVADFTNTTGYGIALKSTSVNARGNSLDFTYRDYNSGSVLNGTALGISPTGTIGINQTAGAEALEVTGNAKVIGSITSATVSAISNVSQSTTKSGIFLNNGMTSGQYNFLALGKSEATNCCAYFSYYLDSTLANSVGRLGIYGKDDIINWSYNSIGRVGINQAPGTEVLEVAGNIKIQHPYSLICHAPDLSTYALVADFTNINGHGIALKSTTVSARGNSLDFTYRDYNHGSVLTGIALGISPTGTIGINKVAGSNALEVAGNALVSTLITDSNTIVSGSSAQGCHIEWNIYGSTGQRYIMNQKGGGVGGIQFGSVNSSNVFDEWAYFDSAGYPVFEKGDVRIQNSGHLAIIRPSTLTGDIILTLPDTDVTLTAYSGPNQSLSTSDGPTFTRLNISGGVGVCIGYNAGHNLTNSTNNKYITLVGSSAGYTGTNYNHYSTFIGNGAGYSMNGAISCTGVGRDVLYNNTSGQGNACVGDQAGYTITTGNANICIGTSASTLTTGSYNILMGLSADVLSSNAQHGVAIGYACRCSNNGIAIGSACSNGTADHGIAIGDSLTNGQAEFVFGMSGSCTYCAFGSTVWYESSDRDKKQDIQDIALGLDFLKKIRPVSFKWKPEHNPQGADADRKHNGFIAQEVKQVIDAVPEAEGFEGYEESRGSKMVAPTAFIPVLVKAVQELEARVVALDKKGGK